MLFTASDRARLVHVEALLIALTSQGSIIMADLSALTTQVTASVTVEQSAIVLIQGLAAQVTAAGTDPAKLAALTSQLNTSAAALAAAVTANTPAAPIVPPVLTPPAA